VGNQLHAPTSQGGEWPGAIVGDLPNPSGALVLAATEYLTTGELEPFESPDFGSLAEFTMEMWFKADSVTPAGGDLIMFGPQSLTGGGIRQWWFTLNADSTITVWVRNSTPSTVSATSGAIAASVWYHVVGTVRAGNLYLYLNGVQAASSAFSGNVQGVGAFGDGTNDFVVGDPSGVVNSFHYDEVAAYRSALPAARILAHYQAGVQRGFPNGLKPGAHIIAALDAAGSQAPRRIGVGVPSMYPNFYAGSALDELQSARQAENVDATIFISKSGEVVFLDRNHRSSSPYNTVQMTLDDDGTDIPYEELSVDYSDDTIANEWNVTANSAGANGTTQTASDATSIASYGRRPQSISGLPVNDTETAAIATAMLAKYKDPILRGTSVTFNCSDPTTAEQVFKRDLGDRIRMLRTPPGGGARIDQNLFIQQIQISGDNSGAAWEVTWGLSPL
jgi:hypothetical protein